MPDSIVHRHGGNRITNLLGRAFGKLTVVKKDSSRSHAHSYWECVCECGNRKLVRGSHLITGDVRSCGCSSWAFRLPRVVTHGMSKHPLYAVWRSMVRRCCDPRRPEWASYGGRGIIVCDRWRGSFSNFYEDMGPSYQPNLSLDRIDNDGPYCKENCRWATSKQQQNNMRTNIRITFREQSHTVAEWAELVGLPRNAIYCRLRMGWTIDRALSEPLHRKCHTITCP